MALLVYSPDIINSYISIAYGDKSELCEGSDLITMFQIATTINNDVFIVPSVDKSQICVLQFDSIQWDWILYHSQDNNLINININEKMVIGFTYIGIMVDNRLALIQSINCSGASTPIPSGLALYNREKNKLEEKVYFSDHSENYVRVTTYPKETFTNSILIRKNEGIVYLNSTNHIDLIFFGMLKITDHALPKETIEVLTSPMYYNFTEPSFNNLKNKILTLQYLKPKQEYALVHKYFNDNDKLYFNTKIKTFQKGVLELFTQTNKLPSNNMCNFMTEFVCDLCSEICIECSTLYHRFRHFPKERAIIYRKYPKHPYIELLKIIHQKYLNKKNQYIDSDKIANILFNKNNSDNKITTLLISALARRSELFVPMYELYLETSKKNIKPKYKTKYNYFPFKIFSTNLFIMEHILAK